MLIERKEWKEFHSNGQPWITGEIGIIDPSTEHQYDCRTGFPGHEGEPVCRLGKWTKHYDNGQLAWTIEYDDFGFLKTTHYTHYRKDGSIITE